MRRSSFILCGALLALPAPAQKLTVVLDPARGGSEYGARIDNRTYEKQVTLDLANRLRPLLTARDFNVVLTREDDTLVKNEQRAAVANQNKPIACILLHATGAGTGVHLWTSWLAPLPVGSTAVLWDEAQAPFVQRSQRLASEFAAAFSRSKIAVSNGRTWTRPLDNMECPAIAIEIGPEDSGTSANDRSYQNHLADAIASQLLFWRGHADVVQSVLNPPPPPAPVKPAATESAAKAGIAESNRPARRTAANGTGTTTGAAPSTPAKQEAPPR